MTRTRGWNGRSAWYERIVALEALDNPDKLTLIVATNGRAGFAYKRRLVELAGTPLANVRVQVGGVVY